MSRNNGIRQKPELLAKVLRLRAEGLTLREVGENVGCSAERVRQILAKEERDCARENVAMA